MPEKMGGGPSPEEHKLPEGWVEETIGEMVGKLKGNPELQQKAFGQTFTDEEFEQRFPGNQVTAADLPKLIDALGYRPFTPEEVEAMRKASEGVEWKDEDIK